MQAAVHECLGAAIGQHCRIVGQDSSDKEESDSASEGCTNSLWSDSSGFETNKAGKKPSATNPYIQAAMAEARHMCTDVSGDLDGDGGTLRTSLSANLKGAINLVCATLQRLLRVKARLVFIAKPICVLTLYQGLYQFVCPSVFACLCSILIH